MVNGKKIPCEYCEGRGTIQPLRCPLYYTRVNPTIQLAFNLYVDFKECNQTPVAGGMLQQSATWYQAVQIFRQVLNELEKESLDRAGK